jgi:hypothetical protein
MAVFEPGSSVPEADVMSTEPSHHCQGNFKVILGNNTSFCFMYICRLFVLMLCVVVVVVVVIVVSSVTAGVTDVDARTYMCVIFSLLQTICNRFALPVFAVKILVN